MATKPTNTVVANRRRRERFWVATIIALIVLFGFFEGWFFRFDPNFPISSNILLFALINLNAILLLLLAYFVLRNIVKLLFERKRNILGHKLRTRLIIAFVGLTLTPTLPLFLIATQFTFVLGILPADINLALRAAFLGSFAFCLHLCKKSFQEEI